MKRRDVLAGAACLYTVGAYAAPPSPVANTTSGRVRGFTACGVHVFKGIPYGDNTSSRRFLPAPPAKPWRGVRDTLDYGPASPQARDAGPVSEDCLSLNVWTPGLDDRRRPVMVYFHGGEYSSGSGASPLYDGARLCKRGDVVAVTVNHRLAVLGHLYLAKILGPAYAASGNVGLLDLVLALRWVRDNISAFGGDPDCVTVFGQSGGGAKIATLMAMPAAQGLFHRAATMSGQQITASGPAAATNRALAFLDALKLPRDRAADMTGRPIEELIAAMAAADPTIPRSGIYWGPVLDETVLPRHPFYPDAAPQSLNIPMMIGNTLDETRAFFRNDAGVFNLTWDTLPARLALELRVDIEADTVVAAYRRMFPTYSPVDVFFAATTAGRSWRAAIIEAEERAKAGAPVYAYQLNWRSPVDGGAWGAAHTLDIPLVFDNTAQPSAISGDGPEARALASIMSETFISFARTGNPNRPGLPPWKPYELADRATLLFELKPYMADDPRGEERRLFAKVPFIQRGTI